METEREAYLEASSAPFPKLCRYLSEKSPQPMVAVDGILHVVSYVNPAFAHLVGKEVDDLIGRPFAEAVPEGSQNGCLKLLDRVFRTGNHEKLAEQEHLQLKQEPVYWSYAVWAILGADESPVGVMIQITDSTETALYRQKTVKMNEALLVSSVTQHTLTERADELSARLQASVCGRDRFLATLSHELRNPLAAVTGGLQLLEGNARDADDEAETREMMDRQLKQIVRLVNDLLDISRITTGKLELHKEKVDLANIVRDAADACGTRLSEDHHRLTVELPPERVMLDADPTRLCQVFLNLINNAAKYSDPGSEIRVVARASCDEVEISVRDNGIGIPEEMLPHIFEPFVQVDPSWERTQGGMGIGLSLVKEFVELHNGKVSVESGGQNQGSVFTVRLPVDVTHIDAPSAVQEGVAAPVLKRRILVVDDNRDSSQSLALMLRICGNDVEVAYNGVEALELASSFQPDVILMDIGMPKMNGYEATRHIRQQPWGKDMTIIALTGWGQEDDRVKTKEAGCNGHLVKPVDLENIQKLLNGFM